MKYTAFNDWLLTNLKGFETVSVPVGVFSRRDWGIS
jgi:hypothetical protein